MTSLNKPSEFIQDKEEKSEAMTDLMAMGFSEDKVRQALKAAYNNR